jgi:hypothetical protein
MNRRDWRYARLMRHGIAHIIRETAKAGFRVDAVKLNKNDRKILRNANPTRSYMICGVPMEVDEEHKYGPYSRKFFLVTNAPKGGGEMMKGIRGVEFPEDFQFPEPD